MSLLSIYISKVKSLRPKQIMLGGICVFILIGSVTYWLWPQNQKPEEPAKLVETEVIRLGPVTRTVTLIAKLNPIRQTTFMAHVDGVIGPLLVQEGVLVTKGTILAELANEELKRDVDHKAESVRLSKVNLERQQKLLKSNNKSQQSYENAQKELLEAQGRLEDARNRLLKTQFIAPYDGVVGVFVAREGQDLRSGDKVVSFYDLSRMSLDIGIPESILPKISAKTNFYIRNQKGTLSSVQRVIDPVSRMALARAELEPLSDVSMGSLVDVDLELDTRDKVISVQRSAVFMKGRGSYVYKVVEGKIELSAVEIGLEGDKRFEITDGVEIGDVIVLKGQEKLYPERKVKRLEGDSKPKSVDSQAATKNQNETQMPSDSNSAVDTE